MGQPTSLGCVAVSEGGVRGGTTSFAWLLPCFQPLSLLPTSKLGPSGADSRVGGFVYILGPCGSLNKLSCEAGSFSHCHNPHRYFTTRGLEALVSCTGTLSCAVCLAPQLFLPVYLNMYMEMPGLPSCCLTDPVL